jgi:hypothetical protein
VTVLNPPEEAILGVKLSQARSAMHLIAAGHERWADEMLELAKRRAAEEEERRREREEQLRLEEEERDRLAEEEAAKGKAGEVIWKHGLKEGDSFTRATPEVDVEMGEVEWGRERMVRMTRTLGQGLR